MQERIKKYLNKLFSILRKPEMKILPGNVAFYFVLAIIPIFTIIVLVASSFSISVDSIIELINDLLPEKASELVAEIISGKGFDGNVGFFNVIAFAIATNGTYAIVSASNTLYQVENNDFIKNRVKSVLLLIILIVLLLFLLLVPMFGDKILRLLQNINYVGKISNELIGIFNVLKWPFSFFIIYTNLKLIYTVAPSAEILSKETTKGAIFTTFSWTVATAIFTFYLEHFANYDILYGNLSSLIILMIWMYILAFLFVLGMAINATEFDNKNRE